MNKEIWIKTALPAFAFGLCISCPQIQVSAEKAGTGITSTGSIVFEDSAGSVAVYAEDIACLQEKLSSVRAEVYSPGSYGDVQKWEYEILTEQAPRKESNLPESWENPAPEEAQIQEPEETPAPGETEMQEPEKTPAPEERETQEPEETPAPEETEMQEPEKTPAPEKTEMQEPKETPAPEKTEIQQPEKIPAPEVTPAQEDTEDKGGAENQ